MATVTRFSVLARCLNTSARYQAALVQPPVPVFGIEGRYATALYSAASKQKKLEATETELTRLKELLVKDAKLADFIANPLIKKFTKRDELKNVLQKQKFSDLIINLIVILAENGRLPKLHGILNTFANVMGAYRGEVLCEVVTAKNLDTSQMAELEKALQGFLKKGEKLLLNTKIDPSIIGGMIISIGDKYIDMSTASKIKLYTSLISQSV